MDCKNCKIDEILDLAKKNADAYEFCLQELETKLEIIRRLCKEDWEDSVVAKFQRQILEVVFGEKNEVLE